MGRLVNYFADTAKDVVGGELFHSNDKSEDDVNFSEGTVVPGTKLAYDNIMFDYCHHNAAGHVPASNTSGVPSSPQANNSQDYAG
jgi:hypothetical protein